MSHVHAVFTAVLPDVIERDFGRFVPDVCDRYKLTSVSLKAAILRDEFPKLFRFAGVLYAKNSQLAEYDARVVAALDEALA